VKSCPLSEFADGDLYRLHSANDDAVAWLQDVAAKALAKWNEICTESAINLRGFLLHLDIANSFVSSFFVTYTKLNLLWWDHISSHEIAFASQTFPIYFCVFRFSRPDVVAKCT